MLRIYSKFNILFVFLLCLASYSSLLSQCSGNITLSTQAQVNDFSCNTVNGNLTISGSGITNLDSLFGILNVLQNVTGNLTVTNCPNLTSLQGLDGVQSVGGNFEVMNTGITTMGNFGFQLASTNFFSIINNDALTNLSTSAGSDAFPSLTNIGRLEVSLNNSLQSISGFNTLSAISGNILIADNNNLSSISGMNALGGVAGKFFLENNSALTDVSTWQDLTVGDLIRIVGNTQLSLCCFAEYMLNHNSGADVVVINAPGCNSVAQIVQPPIISCQPSFTVSTSSTACTASVLFTDPAIVENCELASYTFTLTDANGVILFNNVPVAPGTPFTYILPIGMNTFAYSAEDAAGNTSSCSTVITVIDNTPPTWSFHPIRRPSPGVCGIDDPTTLFFANPPLATDNCGVQTYVDPFVDTPGCGSSFTRTYTSTATDVNGNQSAPFITIINIIDNQGPVLSGVPQDVTINCGDPLPVPANVQANDQCQGNVNNNVTLTSSITLGDCTANLPAQVITRVWTVNDGCMNSASATQTITMVNTFTFDLGDDVNVCNQSSYTINPGPIGTSYLWSTGQTTQSINVTATGTYTVTITQSDGCCHADEILVTFGSNPNATATGNELDCTGAPVVIMANSTTSGVSYAWTGPGGYTSTLQNPSVTVAGSYTVEVTNSQGCTASANAEVTVNNQTPIVSTTGGSLTCTSPSTMISATSTTSNVTYAWTGPNGFTSNIANPTVSTAGTYNVVVTAPNNCVANGSALVTANTTPPTSSLTSGVITCSSNSTQIINTPSSNATNYAWKGPNNFTSNVQSPTVTTGGAYNLTVTASNGCTSTNQISVTQNTTIPNVTAQGGSIPCGSSSILLQGNSTTSGVTYAWSGPGGYTSGLQNPLVNIVGTYTFVVTGLNGCTSSATASVVGDSNAPQVTTTGGSITCATTTVTLTATSSVPNSTFLWSGPNSFTSTMANPTVTVPGNYLVEVTAPNNCKTNGAAQVLNDTAIPSVSITLGSVDCVAGTRQIIASSLSSTTGFTWIGPGGFTSTIPNPSISLAGTYVASTVGTNGCIGGQNITIDNSISYTHNITTTKATATEGGSASITLSGGTPNFNIVWDNGIVGLSTNNLTAGNHNVVVVDGLGCTKVIPFVIEMTVAVNDVTEDKGITLFPNPATSILNIDIAKTGFVAERMTITNSAGQVMMSLQYDTKVDVSTLPSGLYVIELFSGKEVYAAKFMKM